MFLDFLYLTASDNDNNNNINCETSIVPKSLTIFKLRGATDKTIELVLHGDRHKSSLENVTGGIPWWKSIYKQLYFQFLMKGVYSFRKCYHNN